LPPSYRIHGFWIFFRFRILSTGLRHAGKCLYSYIVVFSVTERARALKGGNGSGKRLATVEDLSFRELFSLLRWPGAIQDKTMITTDQKCQQRVTLTILYRWDDASGASAGGAFSVATSGPWGQFHGGAALERSSARGRRSAPSLVQDWTGWAVYACLKTTCEHHRIRALIDAERQGCAETLFPQRARH